MTVRDFYEAGCPEGWALQTWCGLTEVGYIRIGERSGNWTAVCPKLNAGFGMSFHVDTAARLTQVAG